ncbi:putative phage protein (TIGR02216 family) [Aquabacter spiritensis]|uniref:Putative phage protein (TIGR02216 family) n=2 Tax=Aquabacter spiritensis TaxID=933073 RepID=A0A4R3M3M5_9HYPH|nr:putative phage protein (TIGR02216 family) [Aquabacter spiritensis]
MHAGLGLLRLPPDQFWRMTPRELAAALGGGAAPGGGLARPALDALMRRFPDAPRTRPETS